MSNEYTLPNGSIVRVGIKGEGRFVHGISGGIEFHYWLLEDELRIKMQVVALDKTDFILHFKDFYYGPPTDLTEIHNYIANWIIDIRCHKVQITKWNAQTGEKL